MKLNQVHSVEARALARQLADGADGSAAAGRMWKGLIRDLSAAAQAEHEEASRVWSSTEPDKRQFLPQPNRPCVNEIIHLCSDPPSSSLRRKLFCLRPTFDQHGIHCEMFVRHQPAACALTWAKTVPNTR